MTDEMPTHQAFTHSYLAQAEDPETEDQYRQVYATIAQTSAIMHLADVIEFHLGKTA